MRRLPLITSEALFDIYTVSEKSISANSYRHMDGANPERRDPRKYTFYQVPENHTVEKTDISTIITITPKTVSSGEKAGGKKRKTKKGKRGKKSKDSRKKSKSKRKTENKIYISF